MSTLYKKNCFKRPKSCTYLSMLKFNDPRRICKITIQIYKIYMLKILEKMTLITEKINAYRM